MKKSLVAVSGILLVLGVLCFVMIYLGLQSDRKKQAEVAAQMGLPGMASEKVELGELVDFKKLDAMEGKNYGSFAYLGSALAVGGVVCLVGSALVGGKAKVTPASM